MTTIEHATVQDLGGGLYAYIQPDGSWFINNTGFLVGADGVVAVDTSSTERRTRAFVDAIGRVSDGPVHTLFNTHSHPDHVAGNGWLPGATIVAHEGTRTDMLAGRPPGIDQLFEPVEWGELRATPPFLTYTEGVTLWVVPGHGPVCGPELIDVTLAYLRFVQDVARRGLDAGLSPLDAARETDLGEYAEWGERERLVGNLHRAYADIRGTEVDVPTAFLDMVTYNGGKPLHCRA